MGGLYSRIKTWGTTDTLTAADLNAEFDNVLTNFIPQMMSGYSANAAQMQIQTSPGALGSESLATSLSGELERLRFVLSEITGQTYWYQAPVISLSQLNSALGSAALQNKIASGLTTGATGSLQPIFLLPDGSAAKVTLKGSGTNFVYSIAGASYTINTDVAITGLTLAPSSSNTAAVSDTAMSGQAWTFLAGENGSTITIATVGSNISNLVGKYAAFKETSGEYFIARVATSTTLTDCRRGYFFNSSNSIVTRAAVSNTDTITLMQLTWIYATTSLGIVAGYTNPTYSGTAPGSPAIGDYWFDQGNNIWKTYNGTSWVASNSTLIGICIQDTAGCKAARSFDFFEAFSALNTAELILDQNSTATVRSRNIGSQLSVYGTVLNYSEGYLSWITPTNNAASVTVSAGNIYYFYVDTKGNTIIDSVAPHDRRSDLQGFYHPANTYRCLGYAFATGTNVFAAVETFFRNDVTAGVIQAATAAITYPLPDLLNTSFVFLTIDTSGGAFTQFLPPVASMKGKTVTYMKTTSDTNLCTLQVFEAVHLGTTQSCTTAQTTITCASSTGVVVGDLVFGIGIPRGTTVTATTGLTATLSQPVFTTQASSAVTFAQAGGINNNQSVTLATQFELWSLFSTGTQWLVQEHSYAKDWVNFPSVAAGTLLTGTTTNPTYGTVVDNIARWKREDDTAHIEWSYKHNAAGSNGSGTYLFNLPAPINAINTNITGTNAAADNRRNRVGLFMVTNDIAPNIFVGEAMVWSATQLYFLSNNTGIVFGSAVSYFGTATQGYGCSAYCPITGWVG